MGGGFSSLSRKLVRLSSISSMKRIGHLDSGSAWASSKVLDYVRVSHFTEELTFLLEVLHDALGGGVPSQEENGV